MAAGIHSLVVDRQPYAPDFDHTMIPHCNVSMKDGAGSPMDPAPQPTERRYFLRLTGAALSAGFATGFGAGLAGAALPLGAVFALAGTGSGSASSISSLSTVTRTTLPLSNLTRTLPSASM